MLNHTLSHTHLKCFSVLLPLRMATKPMSCDLVVTCMHLTCTLFVMDIGMFRLLTQSCWSR